MLAILQSLESENKAHSRSTDSRLLYLINLITVNNRKLNKTTQMVLEAGKSHKTSKISAPVTTFACSGCLICIQHVFFASSKACSFLHNMSVGAGFCMCSVRARQAEVRRAAFRVWTRWRSSSTSTRNLLHHGFHSCFSCGGWIILWVKSCQISPGSETLHRDEPERGHVTQVWDVSSSLGGLSRGFPYNVYLKIKCLHEAVNLLTNADACVIIHMSQPWAMCG